MSVVISLLQACCFFRPDAIATKMWDVLRKELPAEMCVGLPGDNLAPTAFIETLTRYVFKYCTLATTLFRHKSHGESSGPPIKTNFWLALSFGGRGFGFLFSFDNVSLLVRHAVFGTALHEFRLA